MNICKDFEEKYTPKTIDDIVFADSDSKQLILDLTHGSRTFPVYEGKCGILLYGTPGTGKSALSKLLPDAMEIARSGQPPSSYAVRHEPIKAGNNGMALLAKMDAQASHMPYGSSLHYFVLDEVDRLTSDAMDSLKSTMNYHGTVFIFTTNHFAKIEAGVKDRCHCIEFNAAPHAGWLPLAKRILNDAGITGITDEALLGVIATGNGSARQIVSAIQGVILKVHRANQATAAASTTP